MEAEAKFKKVYMMYGGMIYAVKTADMEAVSKIVKRCTDRLR
jgi:hypothetical protein